jgi:hypothetical protein
MKRWVAGALLILGTALLLVLVMPRRPGPPVPVQALQLHPANSLTNNPPAETPLADADDTTETDDATPTLDIVPAGPGPKGSTARVSLETASGPEVEPGLTPGAVLQNMRSVIRDYSARFGGNPFGNNREITAKLNGGNLKQIVFLKPEDGMRINERGELVDNWGTPFFFHQISGFEMEIRSAGADRRMWTPDDLVIK